MGQGGRTVKLLLVDDDAVLAVALRRGLTAEGFTVEGARDGPEGLWRGGGGGYDLILLDLMLPGLNGYRVCAELRRHGGPAPLLMLTPQGGDPHQGRGGGTRAHGHPRKPV